MYQLGDTLRAMSWFLYLIECRDGSLYTGITTDVARRYVQHAGGKGARYTRAHPPLQLLGAVECPDRSTASRMRSMPPVSNSVSDTRAVAVRLRT